MHPNLSSTFDLSTVVETETTKSDFSAAWGKAARRVGPSVVMIVVLVAAGLTIFEGLTFLSILDRSLLFVVAALVVVDVILLLMFFAKFEELRDARRRISATTQAKDRFEKEAQKVPELESRVKDLDERLGEATRKVESASAEVDRLNDANTKLIARSEEAEARVADLQAESGALKEKLEQAGKQLNVLEAEKAKLAGKVVGLDAERKDLLAVRNKMDHQVEALLEDVKKRERMIQRLDQEVGKEQSSNQRAQFTPSIDLDCGMLGFGILAAKRVFADVKNLGPGIAHDVNLSIADGTIPQPTNYSPAGYWTALAPHESRRVVLGDTNSLPASIRCRVTFSSQFGPCEPAEVVFTPS